MNISRRTFLASSAAAVAAGIATRSAFAQNDRVGVCVVGVNGRGKEHIEQFSKTDGAEVVALCDVDSRVLERTVARFKETYGKTPKIFTDVREALQDPSIDAVTIATPNHWHSLMTIWAIQAGKDVYVEKPMSHSIWEGRQAAALADQSDRIVMHGTQGRSSAGWMRDIKLLQDGFIGRVNKAKGFTYKTGNRKDLGDCRTNEVPSELNWDLWQGPAARQDYCNLYVPYNWHWFWRYGNGETGNQGVHQMDICAWAMNKGLPVKAYSTGGRYAWDDFAETPNTQVSVLTYEDGTMLEFEIRNMGSYKEAGELETGNTFLCNDGYYVEDKGFFDYRGKPIQVDAPMPETKGTWANFIEAVRSRDNSAIRGTAMDAHISSAHCHLCNIAYRVGESLNFDPKTERFTNNDEANKLAKSEYAPGFEVPEIAT
ncbi:MAG: Gfo/Idh/MocA family oxidoreductase [Candidatus Hydrogenedentales bacterium]